MCRVCGCSTDHSHDHDHDHAHDHDHDHAHHHHHHHAGDPHEARKVVVEQEILARNDRLAERNRGWFAGRRVTALNMMSSPGSGKTTLIERMIADLRDRQPVHVIEGDQATSRDATRIRQAGGKAVQVNTGTGCHLDADMVMRALDELDPPAGALVLIENVGNLVCPALFDLGEHARVVVASVTEGDDKPIKYPHMFRTAEVVVLNKLDLLPHVDFDRDAFMGFMREVQPTATVLGVSARTGEGLSDFYGWIDDKRRS